MFSTGATLSYSRRLLLDRLRLLAALGLYHSDDGVIEGDWIEVVDPLPPPDRRE